MSQKYPKNYYPFLCFLTLPWPWWPQRIWCIIQGFKKAKNESNFLKEFTHSIIIISPLCSPRLSTNKCKNGKKKSRYYTSPMINFLLFFQQEKETADFQIHPKDWFKSCLYYVLLLQQLFGQVYPKKKLPSNHKNHPRNVSIFLCNLYFFLMK